MVAFEGRYAVCAGVGECFPPAVQRSERVGLNVCPAAPIQRERDPHRVGVVSGCGDRLLGDGHGFLGPADERQPHQGQIQRRVRRNDHHCGA